MDCFVKGITIGRTTEAFQGIILIKKERSKLKFFCNIHVVKSNDMARPFYKTSGFKCTPKFFFMNSLSHISGFWRTNLKCQVCELFFSCI